jgi:hypothetical protein
MCVLPSRLSPALRMGCRMLALAGAMAASSRADASPHANRRAVWVRLCGLLAASIVFVALAWDGRLHQDEPSYLYAGAYLSLDEILAADFQPTGIPGHYVSRLLHVVLVHAITKVTGPGMVAIATVIGIYLAVLLGALWLTHRVVRELMPEAAVSKQAALLTAFVPVFLYLAFMTLPESPALLLAVFACWAWLRSLHSKPLLWLGVTALALTTVMFLRNNMDLMWIALVGAALLVPPPSMSRMKVMVHGAIAGIAALLLFGSVFLVTDIELQQYFAVGNALLARSDPSVVSLMNVGLEGGLFLLALPLAFLAPQRRLAAFFAVWFVLASVPLFLVFDYVEARYLAPNLVALAGLIALAVVGLTPRVRTLWQRHRVSVALAGVACAALVVGTNALALAVMMHEVRMDHLQQTVSELDRTYGSNYAILVPWALTDFHYLRVAYPNRRVYVVQSVFPDAPGAEWWRRLQDRYYRGQVIRSVDELEALSGQGTHLVYLGFNENFAVANLRRIVSHVPLLHLERQFAKTQFIDHLALSWMRFDPAVSLKKRLQRGYYEVYDVGTRNREEHSLVTRDTTTG